jgi:ribosomal protein L27
MLGLAQQHHPDRNGADDERRHLGARVANGQHQQQVIAGEAQQAQTHSGASACASVGSGAPHAKAIIAARAISP